MNVKFHRVILHMVFQNFICVNNNNNDNNNNNNNDNNNNNNKGLYQTL